MNSPTVVFDVITLPSAHFGAQSDLVPVRVGREIHELEPDSQVPEDIRAGTRYGHVRNSAPYLPQDTYDRALEPRKHRVVRLENDHVRAEILVDLGGRLRSLFDKRSNRELLYVNEVFQPANLALRNAWFSGGVEWNIGTIGHGPSTASTMHTVEVVRDDGAACVRLYEYERMRGVVFSIEFVLHPDATCLLVTNTIRNPNAVTVPMYWWSNIAVPQAPDSRVLVPASGAWWFNYQGRVDLLELPVADEVADFTRPGAMRDAADYFFDMTEAEHPWICAINSTGSGLVQVSSARLRGRKLFVWGTGTGGRRWQSWMSQGTGAYLEIQAGLARTQLEHIPMPADTTWSWTEAYGGITVDEAAATDASWLESTASVSHSETLAEYTRLIDAEREREGQSDRLGEVYALGSGWGALESRRRLAKGLAALGTKQTPFSDRQLSVEQAYWLWLLDETATQPLSRGLDGGSASYQTDIAWLEFLERDESAFSLMHRAVILAWNGRLEAAVTAVTRSLQRQETWQARRILACLLYEIDGAGPAATQYLLALAQERNPGLLAEACDVLLESDDAARVVELLTESGQPHGRLRYLLAAAYIDTGEPSRTMEMLVEGIEVADLAEGDDALGALWRRASFAFERSEDPECDEETLRRRAEHRHPLPDRYEFRMN